MTSQRGSQQEKPARRKRRGGRGLLWMIALSLAGSALLRMGGEGGFAIANGLAAETDSAGERTCTADEDVAVLLDLLQQREAKVSARESALADREQALAVAEAQVRKNLKALATAEAELERMIAVSSQAAEDDLTQLTTVYENMKPKQAAQVFAEMAPEFAAGFLSRMRSDAAAQILAGLTPEQAYAISVLLAGRNASAPRE
jgi:flagellar motility protein MotE (MotC chaperone)